MKISVLLMFYSLIVGGLWGAETLSVCEALRRLEELDGKVVRLRGDWIFLETDQSLRASAPCGGPIVRDGWSWPSRIGVQPQRSYSSALRGFSTELRALSIPPGNVRIVATVTGRLAAPARYKLSRNRPGPLWRYPAYVTVTSVGEPEAFPLSSEQWDRLMEEERHTYPERYRK